MTKHLRFYGPTGREATLNGSPASISTITQFLHNSLTQMSNGNGNASDAKNAFLSNDAWTLLPSFPVSDYPVDDAVSATNIRANCENWAQGAIEIFETSNRFTHVGMQLLLQRALFRTQGRKERMTNEMVWALRDIYGKPSTPKPVVSDSLVTIVFKDRDTVGMLQTLMQKCPAYTLRIWDRKRFDPDC